MANFKSDLARLLHQALHPFRKPALDNAHISATPALNPKVSTPALFIDDLDLSDLAKESGASTSLHALCGKEYPSLDRWFANELLPELTAQATGAPDAAPLFFINLNLKFAPNGRRAARDGLKILEHIRFANALPERSRFAPVVLYSFEPGWRVSSLELNPILSPGSGVVFVQLPLSLDTLSAPAHWARWKSEAGPLDSLRMLRLLNPAAALSGTDLYSHSYRNIAGAMKFCKEFAGDILGEEHEVFVEFRRRTNEDLHLKRLLAIQPDLQRGELPASEKRAAFVEACRNIKFLVVDDEHAEGWSLGLYSGITGSVPNVLEYSRICAAGRGTTSDGRMNIKSRTDDLRFADELAADFQDKLREWKTASQHQTEKDDAHRMLANAHKEAEERLTKTKEDYSKAQPILKLYIQPDATQPDLWLQQLNGCQWIDRFPDLQKAESTVAAALKALTRARRELQQKASFFEQMSNSAQQTKRIDHAALEGFGRERDKAQEIVKLKEQELETAKQRCGDVILTSIETLEQSLAEAENSEAATKEACDKANVELNIAKVICRGNDDDLLKCFRFNLIFLDLRIDPRRDSTSTVRETTGMKILDSIRENIPMLPVIMITASDRTESLREAYSKGAEYWVKGISTGDEMREMVRRASERAALLPLWIDIQKVRERKYLSGRIYERRDSKLMGSFEAMRISSEEDRENINRLLEDAFQTIWEYSGVSFLSASEKSYYFNPVITNLTIIQEIRLGNMGGYNSEEERARKKNAWDDLSTLANNGERVYQKERQLHKLRNYALHRSAKVVTRLDAKEYLCHTIAELLN